ncbi:MAG: hypothetical protein QXS21_06715 [Thermoproteota archaeon]|nr:hypothetical protein [Candidatus Brockarchaeota archaeon]
MIFEFYLNLIDNTSLNENDESTLFKVALLPNYSTRNTTNGTVRKPSTRTWRLSIVERIKSLASKPCEFNKSYEKIMCQKELFEEGNICQLISSFTERFLDK